jgi:hypothetical protein
MEIDEQFSSANISIDAHLLMPVWAFKSAAVYLLFISVIGLALNIVVVVVLLSNPQVKTESKMKNCQINFFV